MYIYKTVHLCSEYNFIAINVFYLIILFQIQLAEARDIKFTQNLKVPLSIGTHILCTGTPSDDLPW